MDASLSCLRNAPATCPLISATATKNFANGGHQRTLVADWQQIWARPGLNAAEMRRQFGIYDNSATKLQSLLHPFQDFARQARELLDSTLAPIEIAPSPVSFRKSTAWVTPSPAPVPSRLHRN
jgi:hypothetical protein